MYNTQLTVVGANKLRSELEYLKKKQPADSQTQLFINARISLLEELFASAEIVDPKQMGTIFNGKVAFSATVTVMDQDTEAQSTYQIVGDEEADRRGGKISLLDPLSRALINKQLGDTVEVLTTKGYFIYEIIAIKYV